MTPPEDAIPQDVELPLGRVVAGNFRIERLIGSGAMGHVYQAEQLSLGKAVAIKVLHPHLASDAKLVRRFQREAKSASRLNHSNSIQIIDSGEDPSGTLYIAMELLSGRDLAQVIRDEFPLPLPRIVRIMSQVLSALDEAHAHGVIHRDLKPSNIMLIERRGQPDFVKVCDYGIAKAQFDAEPADGAMLTVQGLVCGTPEYMSPEQARGEPLDGRADLYSAAVILYHMVTGDIPFRAATPIGIVSRHLSEAPVVPSARRPDPEIPPDLDDLILRGLAKSRELRPPTALVFREELENISAGRIGRRARAAENTIPANQPISGVALTAQVPIASTLPPGSLGSVARVPGVRPLVIGLLLGASLAAVALVVVVRRWQLGPTTAGAVATAASLTGASEPARSAQIPAQVPREPSAAPGNATAGTGAGPPSLAPSPPPALEDVALPGARRSEGVAVAVRERDGGRRRHEGGVRVRGPAGKRAPGAGAVTARTMAAPAPPAAAPPPVAGEAARTPATVAIGGDDKTIASARPPREIVREGETLLSQGEVGEACRRGEEAKKATPKMAPVYKFLGKCYMRAGDPARAKENYRRYLELNPGASDALFIESIVK